MITSPLTPEEAALLERISDNKNAPITDEELLRFEVVVAKLNFTAYQLIESVK